ncbi:hypothetical protein K7472_13440 [Streptomyces sp. PTM05]|uniref:Uncharacterized protein n=1 Tax=Streptantibioticus parmotrematis TaxID=2873249 RepID=A0ABS7QRP1_9ACTN|nr:hypothetical protein [Streptantibioticus parmotrematis]MBY8885850.1 hypothetical protein [Streptantibioticus parmotrematis]
MVLLGKAKEQDCPPLVAIRKIREAGLFEVGREFNIAVDLKTVYGLTPQQLHDVVGWFRGVVSDEDLEETFPE